LSVFLCHVQVVNTQQHARADSWSEDKPGAWFSVSLPPDTPIEPTHYSVRHGYGGGAQMRNWKLLASFDGMAWALARNHVNDESLKGGYAVHTWSLPVRILYLCLLLSPPLFLYLSTSIHLHPLKHRSICFLCLYFYIYLHRSIYSPLKHKTRSSKEFLQGRIPQRGS
jgi:hypothetical protein